MKQRLKYSQVKRKFVFLGILLFFFNYAFNQTNLVPNPSFEVYDTCPINYDGIDQICKAVPWFQPYYTDPSFCGGSTDFYHACAGVVPYNYNGYQTARTGNGYAHAGIYAVDVDYGREYLATQLSTVMQVNKKYCSFFYVSKTSYLYSSTNCLSVSFSIDSLHQYGNYDRINAPTHLISDSVLQDTLNWVLVKGIYTAGGGEKFMTTGCFLPTSQVNYICPTPDPCGNCAYYFDDFGVYELPEIEAGSGGTICEFGDSVQLQASCEGCWDALKYRWWPSVGLSESSILNPMAMPEQTTTYYFGLIDTTETVPCIVDLIDSVTVIVCSGIEPPAFNFNIQPNPGQDNVELLFTHVPEDTKLYIYDMRGKLIAEQLIPKDSKSYSLDVNNFSNAQYIIKCQNSSGTIRKKLMKM